MLELENIANTLKTMVLKDCKEIKTILKNLDSNISVVTGPHYNNTQYTVYFEGKKQSKLRVTIEDNRLYSLEYINTLYC